MEGRSSAGLGMRTMKQRIIWGILGGWLFLAACGPFRGSNLLPSMEPTRTIAVTTVPAGFPAPLPAVTRSAVLESPPSLTPSPESCAPTPPDALGPFYEPGAPVRDRVGEGHVLRGVVRSSRDCSPIPGAQIEFWLAGPDGQYADAYRATVFSGPDGAYRFASHFPPSYGGRPPHIHIRITAPGYQTLVTQYYPQPGQTEGIFDLVLIPAR